MPESPEKPQSATTVQPEDLSGQSLERPLDENGVRVELMQNYARFSEIVDRLRDQVARNAVSDEFERFSSGVASDVYGFTLDGQDYVVKLPNSANDPGPDRVDRYVERLIPGIGDPDLEQLCAYDYQTDAVVSYRIDARPFRQVTQPGTVWLRAADFERLVATHERMYERGLAPDPMPGNLLLGPEGFKVIDYFRNTYDKSARDISISTLWLLLARLEEDMHVSPLPDDQITELRGIRQLVMDRLYTESDGRRALNLCDAIDEVLAEYRTPHST